MRGPAWSSQPAVRRGLGPAHRRPARPHGHGAGRERHAAPHVERLAEERLPRRTPHGDGRLREARDAHGDGDAADLTPVLVQAQPADASEGLHPELELLGEPEVVHELARRIARRCRTSPRRCRRRCGSPSRTTHRAARYAPGGSRRRRRRRSGGGRGRRPRPAQADVRRPGPRASRSRCRFPDTWRIGARRSLVLPRTREERPDRLERRHRAPLVHVEPPDAHDPGGTTPSAASRGSSFA